MPAGSPGFHTVAAARRVLGAAGPLGPYETPTVICDRDFFLRSERLTITPGVVDDDAVEVFTTGWCWALAVWLAAEHHWPMWAAGDRDNRWWRHLLVTPEPGLLLDVEGLGTPDGVVDVWGPMWIPTAADIDELAAQHHLHDALRAAATVGPAVADQALLLVNARR